MVWTHNISPIALDLGLIQIRWYGLTYALSFLVIYFYLRYKIQQKKINLVIEELEMFLGLVFGGILLGGRIGYFLLYRFDLLFSWEFFQLWHGGMSFHGGLTGAVLAGFYFCRKYQKDFLSLTDQIVLPIAISLIFGRIANFINGELWGRLTNSENFGVIFPQADLSPRHPSQLYEALKNLLIALVLFFSQKKVARGIPTFLFVLLYGIGRTMVELFWRAPSDGLILGLPRGALYSLPLIVIGIGGIWWVKKYGVNFKIKAKR